MSRDRAKTTQAKEQLQQVKRSAANQPQSVAKSLTGSEIASGGTINAQAAMLQSMNMVQRQDTAMQIQRVQGNQHIQRVVGSGVQQREGKTAANSEKTPPQVDSQNAVIEIHSPWYATKIREAVAAKDYAEAERLAFKAATDPAKNDYAKGVYGNDFAATIHSNPEKPQKLIVYTYIERDYKDTLLEVTRGEDNWVDDTETVVARAEKIYWGFAEITTEGDGVLRYVDQIEREQTYLESMNKVVGDAFKNIMQANNFTNKELVEINELRTGAYQKTKAEYMMRIFSPQNIAWGLPVSVGLSPLANQMLKLIRREIVNKGYEIPKFEYEVPKQKQEND